MDYSSLNFCCFTAYHQPAETPESQATTPVIITVPAKVIQFNDFIIMFLHGYYFNTIPKQGFFSIQISYIPFLISSMIATIAPRTFSVSTLPTKILLGIFTVLNIALLVLIELFIRYFEHGLPKH